MKNERDEIYKAFSSISPVDEERKREILNHVLNGRREKTMKFNYIRIAVPALVALLICINIAIVKNSPDIVPSASYSESESQSDTEINETGEITATSEKAISKDTEKTKETKETTATATETKATTVTQQTTTKQSTVTNGTTATKKNIQQNVNTQQTTEENIPETTQETEPDFTEQIDTETPQQTEPEQDTGSWLPPISSEARNVFEKAYDIYYQIGVGNQLLSSEPTEIDGQIWYEVTDSRFRNMNDFKTYLSGLFSSEWLDTWGIWDEYMDYNGKLYSTGGGKSNNMAYRGHTFQIISESDSKIEFNATIYCNDNMEDSKPYFYTTPSNPQDYYTFDRYFRMVKENGVWVVDWMQPLF